MFCACCFIDSVYVIRGFSKRNTCIKFDTCRGQWNEVASLNEGRYNAVCTVFEGRIVVSGGYDLGTLNTVKA